MVEFEVNSSLDDSVAVLKRQGKLEQIRISRDMYEREIGVRWMNSLKTAKQYKITRSGHWNRQAEIRKGTKLLGKVETDLGLSSTIRIQNGNSLVFEIKEGKNPMRRNFDIFKKGARIGELQLSGVHFPLLSRLGKGMRGYYNHLKPSEEELLVTSLIALGV